jgi:hypothetical protein
MKYRTRRIGLGSRLGCLDRSRCPHQRFVGCFTTRSSRYLQSREQKQ